MKKVTALLIVLLLLLVLAWPMFYVINEGEQAVVTQFGDPVKVVTDAGLNLKIPFIQQVHRLEKRLLPWDGDPENMQTGDKKRIFIDVWGRWRIVDPMKFFQAVRTEQGGYKILDDLGDSSVRDVIAKYNLIEVVRSSNRNLRYETEELAQEAEDQREEVVMGREKMEKEILNEISEMNLQESYGMELIDVHIKRIDYIESVRQSVYERMQSERLRIARLFESEAQEEMNRILGRMRKELDEIEGELQQKTAEIKGQADAEVIRIAAEGFSKSTEFYGFLRSLEAYKKTLKQKTRFILSSDNAFLQQLQTGISEGNTQ